MISLVNINEINTSHGICFLTHQLPHFFIFQLFIHDNNKYILVIIEYLARWAETSISPMSLNQQVVKCWVEGGATNGSKPLPTRLRVRGETNTCHRMRGKIKMRGRHKFRGNSLLSFFYSCPIGGVYIVHNLTVTGQYKKPKGVITHSPTLSHLHTHSSSHSHITHLIHYTLTLPHTYMGNMEKAGGASLRINVTSFQVLENLVTCL